MQHHFKSVILVALFSLTSIVQAEESCINENKDNWAGDDVSNADSFDNPGCNAALCVTDNASVTYYIDLHNQESEEHRRQHQQTQQEAYKQFLLRRERQEAIADANLPDDVKARRQEYLQNMEQRRELFYRMLEQRRQDAAEKRAASQLRTNNLRRDTDENSSSISI